MSLSARRLPFMKLCAGLALAVVVAALVRHSDAPVRGDDKPKAEKSKVEIAYDALQDARRRDTAAVKALDEAQAQWQRASTALVSAVEKADRELVSLLDDRDGIEEHCRRIEALYVRKFELAASAMLVSMNGQSLAQARQQWNALARYRKYFNDDTFTALDSSIRAMNAEAAALREQESAVDEQIKNEMAVYNRRKDAFYAAAAAGLTFEDTEEAYMAASVRMGNAQADLLRARIALDRAVREYLEHVRDNLPPYLQRVHVKSGDRTVYEAQWVQRLGDESLEQSGMADQRLIDEVDNELVREMSAWQADYDSLVADQDEMLAWYKDYEPRMVARTKRINELAASVGNWGYAKVIGPIVIDAVVVTAEVLGTGGTATAARHAAGAAAEAAAQRVEQSAARRTAVAAVEELSAISETLMERTTRELREQFVQTMERARRDHAARILRREWDELGEVVRRVHEANPKMHEQWIQNVVKRADATFHSALGPWQTSVTDAQRRAMIDAARLRAKEALDRQLKVLRKDGAEHATTVASKLAGFASSALLEKTLVTGSAGAVETGLLSVASDGTEIAVKSLVTLARVKATQALARHAGGRVVSATPMRGHRLAKILAYGGGKDLSKVKLVQLRDIGISAAKAAIATYFAHRQEKAEREMFELLAEAQIDHEIYYTGVIKRLQIGLTLALLGDEIGQCIAARQILRAPNHLRVIQDNLIDSYPANLVIELTFSGYVKEASVRVGNVEAPIVTKPVPDGATQWRAAVALEQNPGGTRLPLQITATDMQGRMIDGDPTTTCMLDMQMNLQGHDRKPDTNHTLKLGGSGVTRVVGKWRGNVYRFDRAIDKVPDFAGLVPIHVFETESIAVTPRDAKGGFPGVPANLNLYEHYAIAFEGTIEVPRALRYRFYLVSDDGSKLWVNDRLVIDNDHNNGLASRAGEVSLQPGQQTVKLHWFQGTQPNIALQLFIEERGDPIPDAVIKATPFELPGPTTQFKTDTENLDKGKGRLYCRLLDPAGAPLAWGRCSLSVVRVSDNKEVAYHFQGDAAWDLDPSEYNVKFTADAFKVERRVTLRAGAAQVAQAGGTTEAAMFDFNFRTVAGDLPDRYLTVTKSGTTEAIYGGQQSGQRMMPPGTYDIEVNLSYGNGAGVAKAQNVTLAAGQCLRLEYGPTGRAAWTVTGAPSSSGCWLHFYPVGASTAIWGHWSGHREWRDLPVGTYDVHLRYHAPGPTWIREVQIREGETTELDLRR
ncbi:MAG: hypothetical protein KF696_14995 [Planctomycetes bacterium]|nr:hypothetical protein [Planctomycetota bacterium]MCW8135874.1 hypothetical protein [Planctomycetota bacterium]